MAATNLDEVIALQNIRLFPNPANSSFQIAGVDSNSKITVYDAIGQVVYNADIAVGNNIDIEEWNAGIYLVKIEYKDFVKVTKLVKN